MGTDIRFSAPPWVDVPTWKPPHVIEAKRLRDELFDVELERMDDMQKVIAALTRLSLEDRNA